MTKLVIQDETMSGKPLQEVTIEYTSERITIRELIRSRVYQETREANARIASQPPVTQLFQPAATEVALHGDRTHAPARIDWNQQLKKALDAFDNNRILIFVDDQQVSDLDEMIDIHANTNVRFLRLSLLMGG